MKAPVQHKHHRKKSFLQRHLDPASRLGEILFGLIMVLGATLTAGIASRDDEKHMLKAALGCNIAWGIIDGIMYVMNCMTVRSGKARLIMAIQKAADSVAALEIIRSKMEPDLERITKSEEREILYKSVLEHLRNSKPVRVSMTREDFYGALACCWLVIASCLPAALPFLILPDYPTLALRVSNGLLIAMLFWVGWKWARYAHTNHWVTGLIMVAIGLALVGVAVLLGG
jgi:VIT1/CCC1 family predicted Fe2+/Mn2+ transporter